VRSKILHTSIRRRNNEIVNSVLGMMSSGSGLRARASELRARLSGTVFGSCTQSETVKYTLNGTTFGNSMTVKDAPETKDNGSCPKGDSTISTFVRVK